MRSRLLSFSLTAALLGLLSTPAAAQVRVLFVGNSFTHGKYAPVLNYNSANVTDENYGLASTSPRYESDPTEPGPWGGIPGIFKKMTDEAGLNYEVHIEAISGKTLQYHYTNALSVIAQSTWNKVVLQELSTGAIPTSRGGTRTAFYAAATSLEQAIHAANTQAQVYLYETWARADLTYPSGSTYYGFPIDTMTQDIHNGYYRQFFSSSRYAGIAPVGDAWLSAIKNGVAMRNPYTPDSKINLWAVDYYHPSKWGSYLNACILFYKLTGVDPRTLGGTEQAAVALGITSADAVALQLVAYQQVNVVVLAPTTPTTPTAAAFTPGNIATVRVGDGAATLTTAATAEFVDEYTLSGTLVQSIPLPTADNGTVHALTNSGTSTSDNLTRTADGRYLLLTGYNAIPGTTGIVTSTVSRVVARIASDGSVNTNTLITDAFSGTNIRSAVSTDGSNLYVSGGNSGIRYLPYGNTGTTTALSSGALVNFRILGIAGGNLYASSSATPNYGINQIGTGLPTAAGAAVTLLPGFPTTSGPSSYGFYFADLSTAVAGLDVVYVADDNTTGGIQKWSLVGGTWTLNGTIGGSTTALLRGLTGSRTGTGTAVQLIASGGGGLYTVTDQAGYNAAPTTTTLPAPFVALPTNTSFRGVAFAPLATALAAKTLAASAQVAIFPNPATDQLTVELTGLGSAPAEVQATLFNALGQQVVARQAVRAGSAGTFALSLAGLANGVYLLRLQTTDAVYTQRVEVRR
ncbi:MAG: T9SS type A sorting domain-containing protein [Janthinobacterium lividum]